MSAPLKVLCLDIEGGFGGSSRSLFESLRHVDRARVAPTVWCARRGAVLERYAALGIPAAVKAAMPKISALPRRSRNLYAYARFLLAWRRSAAFRAELAQAAGRHDLVHFNHEALFELARWLRRRIKTPATLHVRTQLANNWFARRQCRIAAASVDGIVFITENERATFESLSSAPVNGRVIYNVAEPPSSNTAPDARIPNDARLKIACLSNYAWVRGIDRLVDVAEALAARKRRDVLFVLAGDLRLRGSLPGLLGRIARAGGTLEDYARARDVGEYFLFLGHTAEPERVLAACHALIKPTREANPWGRDIIEAMAAGLPVLSVGSYAKFVETGATGILQQSFDAAEMAGHIEALADDPPTRQRLGHAAQARIRELCAGPARARELTDFWLTCARPAG